MDCGIKIPEFWELSVLEVEDYIESYNRVRKRAVKEHILWQHAVINLLDERLIARFCDQKINFTKPWDRYPELLEEEKRMYERQKEAEDLQNIGDSRKRYAAEFNRRRRESYGH